LQDNSGREDFSEDSGAAGLAPVVCASDFLATGSRVATYGFRGLMSADRELLPDHCQAQSPAKRNHRKPRIPPASLAAETKTETELSS
jgi:hypothetical protein